MEEKKHIDRLFQEKLKDFELQPKPEVWSAIENQLVKKKKRRVIPLWIPYGSVAAVLLLLMSSVFWYNRNTDTIKDKPIEITTDDTTKQETQFDESDETVVTKTNKEINTLSNEIQKEAENTSNNTTKHSARSTPLITDIVESEKENSRANSAFAENKSQKLEGRSKENANLRNEEESQQIKKEETTKVADNSEAGLTKEDIAQAIEDNLDNKESIAEAKQNKWYVGPMVAPIQYNTFGNGSPVSNALEGNTKKANTTLSYGLKVNYIVNDRLSIQSGVSSVDLSYSTRQVTAFVFSDQLSFSSNLTERTNISGSNTIAVSNSQSQSFDSAVASRGAAVTLDGDLEQSISYVEVPLEVKYALTKTKLGVNLVGGVSTYILNNNSISLNGTQGTKVSLGQATNINNVNFSTNVGLDLDYKINNKMFMNVSPMFKYQLNTFSKNNGGFRPYFIGVYTGLNFRF